MINFHDVTKENITQIGQKFLINQKKILITGGSGSGKTNLLFTLINQQPHIDKFYLYAKDPYEAKYQFLSNKRESIGLKHFNDSKNFIEYSNGMDEICKN